MQPRISLFPPSLALLLSRARLAALARLDPSLAPLVPGRDAAAALFGHALAPALHDLLSDLARLAAAPFAHEALLEAAPLCGVDPAPWSRVPAVDLAARLLLRAARGDVPARRILRRALVRIERHIAPRPWYVGFARAPIAALDLAAAARRVHGDALVDVFAVLGSDGRPRAAILHRALAERRLTVEGDGLRARTEHAVLCDVVEHDPETARASLDLARPALFEAWSAALALDERPSFTLKPLHERGAAWLAAARPTPDVRRVAVVACEVDDGDRFAARADDALAAMHARVRAASGYMWRATLRCELAGVKAPVDATLELPNMLSVADPRYAAEVRDAIAALGLAAPGASADDLASLGPLEHGAWRFVEVVGAAAFARAQKKRTVVPVSSRRPGDETLRRLGSLLVAHELEGEDVRYAVAAHPSIRAREIAPGAMTRWRIDPSRLARVLRQAMDLAPPTLRDAPPDGVTAVGVLRAKGARVFFFQLLRVVRPDEAAPFAERLRRACIKGTPLLLVGPGRRLGTLDEIELTPAEQIGAADVRRVVRDAAELLGLEGDLDPSRFATEESPLVLLRATGEAYLMAAPLKLTANQVTMLLVLADAPGAWVPPGELGRRISKNATIPDQIVRKAYADLAARVRASCAAASVSIPEAWVTSMVKRDKGKGYRLGIGAVVR